MRIERHDPSRRPGAAAAPQCNPIKRVPRKLNVKRFTLALLLCAAPAALAHDFWIEPSTFRPAAGQIVSARLRVGQKMQGDPVPRIPSYVERFIAKGSAGDSPMIGQPGSEPAGLMRINEPGLHWIGYQSNPTPLTQEAVKFENYLRDEGLESIIEKRAKSGQTNIEGRERFYRCAKSLLATGDASTGFETPLGFTLELVPHKNPYALHAGGEIPVTILFHGKPLANVHITDGVNGKSWVARVILSGRTPTGVSRFTFADDAIPYFMLALRNEGRSGVARQWIENGKTSEAFVLDRSVIPQTRWRIIQTYLALGYTHILPRGLDHVLFVLGIFLLAVQLRAVLWQVSAFTIAHTITLALTAYGVVSLPPRIVEPLIALSIVYVAVENVFTSKLHAWRPLVVFCFGLLHGMGFAGVLTDIGLPRSEFVPALLAFNAGVELGQLTVILKAFL